MTTHDIAKYVKNQRLHFRCTCGHAAIFESSMNGLMRMTTEITHHKRKTEFENRKRNIING